MCAKQLLVYLSNWILRTLTEVKSSLVNHFLTLKTISIKQQKQRLKPHSRQRANIPKSCLVFVKDAYCTFTEAKVKGNYVTC